MLGLLSLLKRKRAEDQRVFSLSLSLPCVGSHQNSPATLLSDLQPPEPCDINVCCLTHPVYGISLKQPGLRHSASDHLIIDLKLLLTSWVTFSSKTYNGGLCGL